MRERTSKAGPRPPPPPPPGSGEAIHPVLTCQQCNKPIATEAFCACGHFAGKPVGLTPEMLSWEDREMLVRLRREAFTRQRCWCGTDELAAQEPYIQWADRLLQPVADIDTSACRELKRARE